MKFAPAAIAICAGTSHADGFDCSGKNPDWTLRLMGDAATFSYLDRTTDLSIPQRSVAEGSDWPQAMTLIGARDSAIIVMEKPSLGTYLVRILTQRGEMPILLAGSCQVSP